MRIVMRDIRAANMCSRGARNWFDSHGIDWVSFLKNGVDENVILSTGCPLGRKVVEAARGRQQ